MKLSSREAPAYFRKPDPTRAGLLIYGADAMRVALRRQEVIAALVGPEGEAEMRLTRLAGADLRKDAASLLDALKAQGFFPGPRVVHVEDTPDNAASTVIAALSDWQAGDAQLVVTAGALKPSSALRKAFEADKNAYAVGLYDDPPSREEVEGTLAAAGLTDMDRAAIGELQDLARILDPGDFRQTVERIALYKIGDASPLSAAEVTLLAPASTEAALDDILHAVAEAQADRIGPLMARLKAQGVQAVALAIGATRHFRALYAAASDPGGAQAGIARVRPPVHWKSRDRMQRQAQGWGAARLEQALGLLIDADLTIRSANPSPDMAVMERTLIRLAMMARR